MKLNFSFLKKAKPIYWVVGAVAIFVLFYVIMNRGGKASNSGGGITTIVSGPTEAQTMASANLAMAQIEANAATQNMQLQLAAIKEQGAVDVAIANLGAQYSMAETQAQADVAKYLAQTEGTIQLAGLDAQKEIAQMNAQYSYDTARLASEVAISSREIDAAILNNQLTANVAMFRETTAAQTKMYETQAGLLTQQSILATIPTLKKKNRDDVLLALTRSGTLG